MFNDPENRDTQRLNIKWQDRGFKPFIRKDARESRPNLKSTQYISLRQEGPHRLKAVKRREMNVTGTPLEPAAPTEVISGDDAVPPSDASLKPGKSRKRI